MHGALMPRAELLLPSRAPAHMGCAPMEGHERGKLTATGALSRRGMMGLVGAVATSTMPWAAPPPARAALVQFPANLLRNQYILVRAARSAGEEQGVMVTNPVWKTNGTDQLGAQLPGGVFQRHHLTPPPPPPLLSDSGICGLTANGAKQVYSDIIPALQVSECSHWVQADLLTHD